MFSKHKTIIVQITWKWWLEKLDGNPSKHPWLHSHLRTSILLPTTNKQKPFSINAWLKPKPTASWFISQMETNNWNQTENKPWGAMNVFTNFKDFYQQKYFPLHFFFCQECSHLTVQQIVEFAKLPTVPYGSLQTKAPMMVWRWWTPTETNTTSWGHFTWGTFNGIQLSNLNSNYGWKPMAISKEFSKPVWTSKKKLENMFLNLLAHWIYPTSKWKTKTNKKSGSFDTLQVPKSKQVRIWKSSSGRDLSETWFIFRVQPL